MFTEQENHKLTVIQKELANILKNIKSYSGALSYNDTHYSIVATFDSKFINEISHRILKKSNRDISVCIDLEKKVAYYRKNKTLKVDLGELAQAKENYDRILYINSTYSKLTELKGLIDKGFSVKIPN
jgi:hypothetical protein